MINFDMLSKLRFLVFLLGITTIINNGWATTVLKVVVLDVGEGQSILLVSDERGVLIDTGTAQSQNQVLKKLKQYGVSRLDKIILSHLHPDHAGAASAIMDKYPNAQLYESGHRSDSSLEGEEYHKLIAAFDAIPFDKRILKQGDELRWQECQISILWPPKAYHGSVNGNSLVLLIRYSGSSLLIMGDAGQEVEEVLLAEGRLFGPLDVLVAGHHGAKDASSEAFMEKIQPHEAVISVDLNNRNGYPDPRVVKRLLERSERVRLTSQDGDVVFAFGPKPPKSGE